MKKIDWSDKLSVGVNEIDEQHRKLITMANDLLEAKDKENDERIISDLITRMSSYIDYHFGTEENYMTRFHYPDLVRHREEHRAFIRKVMELRKKHTHEIAILTDEILDFLNSWIENHIQEVDKAYSLCFHENGLI